MRLKAMDYISSQDVDLSETELFFFFFFLKETPTQMLCRGAVKHWRSVESTVYKKAFHFIFIEI